MCECCQPAAAAFFDSIAPKWDSWENLESLNAGLDHGLKKFGLQPDEHVLDVGCGTGNLTAAVLRQLSQSGRIAAIDISSGMIAIAQAKVNDSRVQWKCDAVEHLAVSDGPFDRIICYSVWPHLADPQKAGRLFLSLLRSGGKLHVWHLISREAVNKIHVQASDAVRNHLLAPAEETASLLEHMGYSIEETQDDTAGYLVTASKP